MAILETGQDIIGYSNVNVSDLQYWAGDVITTVTSEERTRISISLAEAAQMCGLDFGFFKYQNLICVGRHVFEEPPCYLPNLLLKSKTDNKGSVFNLQKAIEEAADPEFIKYNTAMENWREPILCKAGVLLKLKLQALQRNDTEEAETLNEEIDGIHLMIREAEQVNGIAK